MSITIDNQLAQNSGVADPTCTSEIARVTKPHRSQTIYHCTISSDDGTLQKETTIDTWQNDHSSHLNERHNSVDKAVNDLEACGGPHVSSHEATAIPSASVARIVANNDIRNLEKTHAVLYLKTNQIPYTAGRIA